jgi:response regulator RpfG family c-di-GMP phosphodiesterase
LCEHLKLIRDDEHRKQISTGCFLHDMEAEKFEIPLMFDKSQFSEEHKKLWLAHSTKAVETLGVLNHVDQQVLSIIAQHEEIPNGSGFPKKMIRKEMDPIACVVSLANRFDHYSTRHHGDKKAAIDEFFTAELGKYDLDQLELLRDVISKHV